MTLTLRLGRFFQAVVSGYLLLVANTIYVLASVPLALHYLQKREFGLWALTMQLTGYLQLVDLGMSASVSRHLIDHKDDRSSGGYGSMVQTGFLVLSVQGLLVLTAAAVFIYFGTDFLRIDPDLQESFKIVMLVQCAIVAADFPGRLVGHMLVAHQRSDITNYSQTGMFVITYVGLWFFFAQGFGIFSLVWANLIGWAGNTLINVIACIMVRIFPSSGTWGRASWNKFRELFGYGKDVFWVALGTQMINASQSIVITRTLGLNTAAVWSVCTRTFTLANQLVWRPFDFSYPMLSEMVVRNERERLLRRFKGLVMVCTSLAVLAAAMFATCNQPFIRLWTHGTIGWGIKNDLLLALWLIVLALVHCHCGFVLITKRIGWMRYVYFIEGVVFLISGSHAARRFGIGGLIATSLVCSIIFSASYGIHRTVREFKLPVQEVLGRWLRPPAQLLFGVSIVAFAVYWLTPNLSPQLQLLIRGGTVGAAGTFLFIWRGLGRELRDELRQRTPAGVSRLLDKIFPGPISSQPAERQYD
jgi:O-antigen/teichoic acid export membrane protein